MSSTEPPSRVPPRQQPHETKAAREELSSKGKVEKVREVDPDEETRKKKFLKYYKGDEEEGPQEERPSPFDLYSGKQPAASMGENLGEAPPPGFSDPGFSDSDFSEMQDAIVPGPSYTPSPNVQASPPEEEGDDEEAFGSLPQSEDFWNDFGLPDQPASQRPNYQETPGLSKKAEVQEGLPTAKKGERHAEEHKRRTKEITKKEAEVQFIEGKVEKKKETHETFEKKRKVEEPSPFGPPGKPAAKKPEEKERAPIAAPFPEEKKREVLGKAPHEKKEEKAKVKLSSPFEAPPPEIAERKAPLSASQPPLPKHKEKLTPAEKEQPVSAVVPETMGPPPPPPPGEKEGERRERPKEESILEIEAPSRLELPTHIQPMAMTATTQAAPYLTAATVSLFYQMVGTMYVMSGTQGVSRTEVILNNPAYANSKFYGSIITIEKYATAPDSFNIRLSGSHEAVATFKENIPGLLSAFQNGNFSFRVGRLDVEYTLERPLFRRKEKGSEKGEAGSGDLGERRNE